MQQLRQQHIDEHPAQHAPPMRQAPIMTIAAAPAIKGRSHACAAATLPKPPTGITGDAEDNDKSVDDGE